MNNKEIVSIKLLRLKYKRGDQIIQTFPQNWFPPEIRYPLIHFKIEIQKRGQNNSDFLQNWFPQKLGPSSLIWRNVETLRKVLLNHAERIQI